MKILQSRRQTGDIQNVKTLAATGHQEKALVGALSVIVQSSRRLVASSSNHAAPLPAAGVGAGHDIVSHHLRSPLCISTVG